MIDLKMVTKIVDFFSVVKERRQRLKVNKIQDHQGFQLEHEGEIDNIAVEF